MNKKLLSLAVGAALGTAPMIGAQAADVKVYGQVQAEVASESSDPPLLFATDGRVVQGGNNQFQDNITMEDNARGRYGLTASEDLGNGLTAIAKIEYDLGSTTDGGGPTQRDTLVGLKGGFGEFQAGRLKSAYKYTGGVKYDPFVTTNLEARRYGGMTTGVFGHNSFVSNHLGYKNDLGAVGLWITYSPDEQSGTDGDMTASVKFGGGAWEAFGALAHDDDADGAGNAYDVFKVGGQYRMGPHKLSGQWESGTDESGGVDADGSLLFLGYQFKTGNTTLAAQMGTGTVEFDIAGADDQESTYFALGAIHKFSKQTRIFGGFASMEVENAVGLSANDGDRDVVTAGLRMDF
ncbi:MAG: porin [Gammaproteobacteria bacterium]|nr:porin [Gammaproteobacteria bacterium]NIR98438.1 porin [Gammaproteobacteria bacterium]NIT64185.1 porin [Gammaproteobacteria bacterium]NIV21125.1 porin [Gammaproteobacteria bacterium]NIX10602.1 porin [Gammaproteobacteria bacterium]